MTDRLLFMGGIADGKWYHIPEAKSSLNRGRRSITVSGPVEATEWTRDDCHPWDRNYVDPHTYHTYDEHQIQTIEDGHYTTFSVMVWTGMPFEYGGVFKMLLEGYKGK